MKNGLEINKYGDKYWYKNDKLHRDDGPAVEYSIGNVTWYKEWFKEGKLHRINGPARECGNNKYWYYEGKRIKCKSQEEFEKIIRLKMFW